MRNLVMQLNFLTKRRPTTTHCEHTSEVRLEIAGLNRSVCESCGRVSVEYLGDHLGTRRSQELVLISPDEADPDSDD